MNFSNCYEDLRRADAYATLEFANTYYLAYRDLPAIIERHVTGTRALDFGCGTGRSTRFLRDMGFAVSGVDTSEEMLRIARSRDPAGDYRRAGRQAKQVRIGIVRFDRFTLHARQHPTSGEIRNSV